MNMTHYMELLATNQPWNLLIYMAIPVILAETVAITELSILFTRRANSWVRALNRWAGGILGVYFLGIFLQLFISAFLPLTMTGGWRSAGDFIAVSSYLLGVVPLFGITLLEAGLLGKKTEEEHLKLHATFVAIFLVVAHVAMIFGMLAPSTQAVMPM